MSRALFERLTNHAEQQGVSIRDALPGRFIKRLNADDAELMARADTSVLMVTRQIKLVRISWGDEVYFSVFGLSEPEEFPCGLECVNLTPGTFALSILEAHVLPRATPSDIRDAIDDDSVVEGDHYEGYELDLITPLFPDTLLYRVSEAQEYHKSDHRVLGSLLANTYLDGPIQFEPDTITLLSAIFEAGSRFIPYKNLVQGILAISWENLFLEIYRCIEQLYAGPRIRELRQGLYSNLSLHEMAALLEKHLSWRPKEDEALGCVIDFCDKATISSAYQCLGTAKPKKTPDQISAAAARQIYKLRNRIVHYRPALEAVTKNESEWNAIVRAMLEIVRQVYDRHGKEFFEELAAEPHKGEESFA